jgi:hypothetical protein
LKVTETEQSCIPPASSKYQVSLCYRFYDYSFKVIFGNESVKSSRIYPELFFKEQPGVVDIGDPYPFLKHAHTLISPEI